MLIQNKGDETYSRCKWRKHNTEIILFVSTICIFLTSVPNFRGPADPRDPVFLNPWMNIKWGALIMQWQWHSITKPGELINTPARKAGWKRPTKSAARWWNRAPWEWHSELAAVACLDQPWCSAHSWTLPAWRCDLRPPHTPATATTMTTSQLQTKSSSSWSSGVAQWLGRRSLAGGLSLIYDWPMVDMWPLHG